LIILTDETDATVEHVKQVVRGHIQTGSLVPWISKIDRNGRVTILFSKKLAGWNNETLDYYSYDGNKTELLTVRVVQDPESGIGAGNLTFTWQILNVTEHSMELQILFDFPQYVSAAAIDRLMIVFKSGLEFRSGSITVKNFTEIEGDLWKQLPQTALVEAFK